MELEGDNDIEKLIASMPTLIESAFKRHSKCLTNTIAELCAQYDQGLAATLAHELVAAFRNQADVASAASGGAPTMLGGVRSGAHVESPAICSATLPGAQHLASSPGSVHAPQLHANGSEMCAVPSRRDSWLQAAGAEVRLAPSRPADTSWARQTSGSSAGSPADSSWSQGSIKLEQRRESFQSMGLIGEGSSAQKKEKLRASDLDDCPEDDVHKIVEGGSLEGKDKGNLSAEVDDGMIGVGTSLSRLRPARTEDIVSDGASAWGIIRSACRYVHKETVKQISNLDFDRKLTGPLQSGNTKPTTPRAWIGWIVLSPAFSCFASLMIVANAALLGFETQHGARYETVDLSYYWLELFFTLWFAWELLLRMIWCGYAFLVCSKGDGAWNYMDIVFVSVSLFDVVVYNMHHSKDLETAVRCIRLLRLLRVSRDIPSGGVLGTFKKMIVACMASMSTMVWSLFLLGIVMYAFAIVFTAATSDCLLQRVPRCSDLDTATLDELRYRFGSLEKTMYTLYSCVAEPGWVFAADLLMIVHPRLFALFLCFIHLTLFGLVQIINAVFVAAAISSAEHCREIRIREKLADKERYADHLREIFQVIDADGSGEVTKDELVEFLTDDRFHLQMCLEALDLNASDADTLFTLLDWDDSGSVDIGEFCDGCLRLKGEASAFDMNCLLFNVRRMSKHVVHLTHTCDEFFDVLKSRTGQAAELKAVRQTSRALSTAAEKFHAEQGAALEALQGNVQFVRRIAKEWNARPVTAACLPQEPSSIQTVPQCSRVGSFLLPLAPPAADTSRQRLDPPQPHVL